MWNCFRMCSASRTHLNWPLCPGVPHASGQVSSILSVHLLGHCNQCAQSHITESFVQYTLFGGKCICVTVMCI